MPKNSIKQLKYTSNTYQNHAFFSLKSTKNDTFLKNNTH